MFVNTNEQLALSGDPNMYEQWFTEEAKQMRAVAESA